MCLVLTLSKKASGTVLQSMRSIDGANIEVSTTDDRVAYYGLGMYLVFFFPLIGPHRDLLNKMADVLRQDDASTEPTDMADCQGP